MRKRISKKVLGEIYSAGNDRTNTDFFHIYSEKALFDFDTVRKMNLYVNSKKLNKIFFFDGNYDLKKNNFLTGDVNLDDWGSRIIIMRMKVPYFGEGIACVHTFDFFENGVGWFNSTFVNNFMDFKDYGKSINIYDKKICFSFFNPIEYLDFFEVKDFFKSKNKENKEKFDIFIKERFERIKNQWKNEQSIFSLKIPDGKYKIYSMICNYDFEGSFLQKNITVGNFIKIIQKFNKQEILLNKVN